MVFVCCLNFPRIFKDNKVKVSLSPKKESFSFYVFEHHSKSEKIKKLRFYLCTKKMPYISNENVNGKKSRAFF